MADDGITTAAGLLTRFQTKQPSPKGTRELATVTTAFGAGQDGMENPGWLISAKGFEEIDKLRRDDAFGAFMDMKKSARLSPGFSIVPASDEDTDTERADFIQYVIDELDGSLKANMREILSAMEFGYSITNKPMKL